MRTHKITWTESTCHIDEHDVIHTTSEVVGCFDACCHLYELLKGTGVEVTQSRNFDTDKTRV